MSVRSALIAFGQAGRFFSAALELWPEDDPSPPTALLRLAYTRSYGRAMDESFFEARDALLARESTSSRPRRRCLSAAAPGSRETRISRSHICGARTSSSGTHRLLLEGAGPHWLARSLALADQIDEAISLGRETIEMAEILGLDELRANALTTIGFSRFTAR